MSTQNSMRTFFSWDDQSGVTKAGAGKFPNPFCDIASEYVPRDLNTIFEWCTPAGTQVELDVYGRLAAVESLLEGDTVVSDKSAAAVIDKTSSRHHGGDVVVLKAAGLSGVDLTITPEHPLLVADDKGADVRYVPAGEVTDTQYVVSLMPSYDERAPLPYSPYLCGAYVAEGNVLMRSIAGEGLVPRAVRFTIGAGEHAFAARLVDELVAAGAETALSRTPAGRDDVLCVEATHPDLARYLVSEFGRNTGDKSLPPALFHAPHAQRLRFLAGWADGDGHLTGTDRRTPQLSIYSASRQLAWQGLKLAYSCGCFASFMRRLREDGPVSNNSWEHRLTFWADRSHLVREHMVKSGDCECVPGRSYDSGVCVTPDYIYRRVQSVDTVRFNAPVYNIRVADTHSYTVNGIVCHNCEYLMLSVTPFRAVSQRVVRYFLTDLVLEGQSDNEREKYEDFLNNQLHVIQQMAEIGDDYMCYGNAFVSIYFPFDRFLICPKCHTAYHISTMSYKFNRSTGTFTCDCKKCECRDVEMRREDRRSPDTSRVKIIRWSPKEMRLRVHPISGKIEYYLKMDSKFVQRLLDGEPFYLNETPWPMIEACLKSDKSKKEYLFKFKDDAIYHMRCSTLAGLPIKGWAIPPILPNFKLAYYVQLLRRYDEAIALDFIIPFRILYPNNTSPQGQDALSTMNMSSFIGHMQQMINSKRKNLTDIAVVPFSIGYESLGGEARSLAPKDNIALAVDELLNSLGFPAELYKGTLSIQAFPVALRLFEKQWNSLVDGFNDFSSWLCKRLSRHFMWGEVDCSLRSVTLADDVERKALSLQAAAGQDISKQTAYRPLGIDYLEEQKRVVEEQETIQKLQQEAMARAQAQQGQQTQGQGGAAPAGATPGDVYEQAKALAQQLLLQTPETMRRGELIKIKHSNPTLHALVLQEMDTMRQDMARQGQAQVMEQMKQAETGVVGFGAASALPSPIRVGLMIADQLTEYNRDDLRKIAMDVKDHIPHADDAFRYVYRRMMGWE